MRGFQSRNWGWWYVSIGAGFVLLAIVQLLHGAGLGRIVFRIAIALGFAALGALQFRNGR